MTDSLAVSRLSVSQLILPHEKKPCSVTLQFFTTPVLQLPKRILYSFSPPFSYKTNYLFTDFLGPTLSTVVLLSLLLFGFDHKRKLIRSTLSPWIGITSIVLSYYISLSLFIFLASRLIRVKIRLLDVFTLIGFSFYGFIFTLAIPLALQTVQDHVFYSCLILFGGLSSMRVLLILIFTIETPIARFLICALIGTSHMLFVIYLYYKYIHPTHVFGKYPN